MSMEKTLKEILDEILDEVEQELEEATTTAGVDGYNTPFAFGAGRKKDKKKEKDVATQAGYTIAESVNEAKKRFDVDFYKGNGDRQTSHEEIIRGDKFSDIVSQATKIAKSKGMNHVEFHYKDAFIGSIDKRNNYSFKKGRGFSKSPLSVNEDKFYNTRVQYTDPKSKKKFVGDVVRKDGDEYKVNLGKDGRFEKYILAKEKDLKIVSKSTKRTFESVNEAKRSVVHKAAKKGSFPVTLVVVKNGKVVDQESVKTPEAVPAAFNVIQSKHKGATIHIEDKTGKRLFSESVNEAFKPSQVRSSISRVKKQLMRKWKQKGGYENFGQKELSQMRDKFDYNPYGSSDEREIAKMLDGFDNWAMNYDGSMREGKKRFKRQDGIGKSKYTISYHDGKKKHKDGSDFFDIKIFKNKKDLSDFVGTLVKQGYKPTNESINEAKVKRPVNRWLELKNDESMHPHKKMAMGLKELKYQLKEVEKFFNWYNKIKTMNELDSQNYWKRTNNHIYTIKEKLIKIAKTIQEIEK